MSWGGCIHLIISIAQLIIFLKTLSQVGHTNEERSRKVQMQYMKYWFMQNAY